MNETVGKTIFGGVDGFTSCLGLVVGMAVAHDPSPAVLTASVGLAISSGIGMAGSDRLGGTAWRLAGILGLATLLGTLLAALPLIIWPGTGGMVLTGILTAVLGVVIAEERRGEHGRWLAYRSTFGILVLAAVLPVVADLVLGVSG